MEFQVRGRRAADNFVLGNGHFKSVTGLSFSRGRFELFSGSLDRAILIWDCDRTKEILFSEENRDDHRKRGMNSISSMRSLFNNGHQVNFLSKQIFRMFPILLKLLT